MNQSERTRRNILFHYRDAADIPAEKVHFDWGMGLMVSGENADFNNVKPSFQLTEV